MTQRPLVNLCSVMTALVMTACANAPSQIRVAPAATEVGDKSKVQTRAPKLPFALTETEAHWFRLLDNAAERDRAIASLLRTYQVLLRSAFSTLRLANSFPATKSREGLHQLARFYRSRGPAFVDLGRRAALMTTHLQALRSKWKAPGKLTRERQARISQYRAIFDCIDRDGKVRGTHVLANETARATLGGYRQELARMKLSMRCSSLIARRRALR